jgi:(1->4)-alpha-D-glucan 1-alpha-D-glucosylmutase
VRLADAVEQPPMKAEVWKTTRVVLPATLAGRSYRNIFTGELLTTDNQDGNSGLWLSHVLGSFPVTLLEACSADKPLS